MGPPGLSLSGGGLHSASRAHDTGWVHMQARMRGARASIFPTIAVCEPNKSEMGQVSFRGQAARGTGVWARSAKGGRGTILGSHGAVHGPPRLRRCADLRLSGTSPAVGHSVSSCRYATRPLDIAHVLVDYTSLGQKVLPMQGERAVRLSCTGSVKTRQTTGDLERHVKPSALGTGGKVWVVDAVMLPSIEDDPILLLSSEVASPLEGPLGQQKSQWVAACLPAGRGLQRGRPLRLGRRARWGSPPGASVMGSARS